MTSLSALLAKYASESTLRPENKPTPILQDIFVEAVGLLWNLCEANADAVAIFTRENMISFLLSFLEADNLDLVVPIMQCIYTVRQRAAPFYMLMFTS